MQIASVDGPAKEAEDSSEEEPLETDSMPLNQHETPAKTAVVPPRQPVPPGAERHNWKLGEGVWADITITGALSPKAFEKLKKYIALIDVSEEEPE